MRYRKFLKNNSWGIILTSGIFMLFWILSVYYNTGFDKNTFWESVLSNAFVDVISLIITTFLVSYLVGIGQDYKTKKEFYEIIKFNHIKVFYSMENEYLKIFDAKKDDMIDPYYSLELKDIKKHIEQNVDDGFFRDEICIDSNKSKVRADAFREYEEKYKGELIKFIQKYAVVFPSDYKKLVFKLENLIDSSILPNSHFSKGILIEEQTKYSETLRLLVNYFDDINKKEVSSNIQEKYGWDLIAFLTISFIMVCVFINFCIYLYNL